MATTMALATSSSAVVDAVVVFVGPNLTTARRADFSRILYACLVAFLPS